MGTSLDKSESSVFTPTRIYWQSPLEILGVQSSAAAKFVNIPIDDMFIRWRDFSGDDEDAAEAMKETSLRHLADYKLSKAMKAARQYGTGVIVMMTEESPLETPLVPEQIREGDLSNLLVLHRYELSTDDWVRDLFDPQFGKPFTYQLFPQWGGAGMRVHHSRVIRFDGLEANTDSGFVSYDNTWGISALIPVIVALLHDQGAANAIAHLIHEASIPVLKINELYEKASGQQGLDEPSLEDVVELINRMKSNYRMMTIDGTTEEFLRVAVQFGGLADIMEKYQHRIAAAAEIPITRWEGRSPDGLNATGDSDWRNHVMRIEALRTDLLVKRNKLQMLDTVLARDAGLDEAPDFEWRSLLELSEKEQAEVAEMKVKALAQALADGVIDEDEYRAQLSGDPIFGILEGLAPELDDLPEDDGDMPENDDE